MPMGFGGCRGYFSAHCARLAWPLTCGALTGPHCPCSWIASLGNHNFGAHKSQENTMGNSALYATGYALLAIALLAIVFTARHARGHAVQHGCGA